VNRQHEDEQNRGDQGRGVERATPPTSCFFAANGCGRDRRKREAKPTFGGGSTRSHGLTARVARKWRPVERVAYPVRKPRRPAQRLVPRRRPCCRPWRNGPGRLGRGRPRRHVRSHHRSSSGSRAAILRRRRCDGRRGRRAARCGVGRRRLHRHAAWIRRRHRRRQRWTRRHEGERVDVALLVGGDTHAEVHVRLRELCLGAGGADRPYDVALGDLLSAPHHVRAEVEERHGVPVRGLDRHRSPRTRNRACERHRAGHRRHDRRADGRSDVDSSMLTRFVRVRTVEGERGENRARHRPAPAERRSRRKKRGSQSRENQQAHRGRPPLSEMETRRSK
jgi:hypothetical protein